MKKSIFAILVLAMITISCSENSYSENFTTEKIEKDIIGKTVGILYQDWVFAKDNKREIEILEVKQTGTMALVKIHMRTIENKEGDLLLEYRKTEKGWELKEVLDISFLKK